MQLLKLDTQGRQFCIRTGGRNGRTCIRHRDRLRRHVCRGKLCRNVRNFSREIIQPEVDDLGIPIRENFLEFLQFILYLGVLRQRLLRLAGIRQRIGLLDQTVNDEVLVIRILLRSRGRQSSDEQKNDKNGEKSHVGKIPERHAVWQRRAPGKTPSPFRHIAGIDPRHQLW